MKLKVVAQYKDGKPSDLTLYKERITVKNGKVFEITDEERANEILNATFQGKPVVEVVEEEQSTNNNDNSSNNNNVSNNENTKGLEDMTVNELKELAVKEGIELTATKKDEIINEIETARQDKTNSDKDKDNGEDNNKGQGNKEGNDTNE